MKFKVLALFILFQSSISSIIVPKIFGGQDTNISSVPWQLLHLVNGEQNCGGVIIGSKEVLTAAHCYALSNQNPSVHSYRAGSNNRLLGGTIHAVDSFTIHPEFNYSAEYITHDIAFVRVKEAFQFSEEVQPIKLAENEPKNGEPALLSGWGIFKVNGSETEAPIILQSITLPVVERDICRDWYSDYFWEVRDDMVCVGTEEGGSGSCNGDSGGPMAVNNQLVGVMSWMDPCAKPHHPSVYTSVPYYRDWIEKMLASNN